MYLLFKTTRSTQPLIPVTVAPVTIKVATATPQTPKNTTRTQTSLSPPSEPDTSTPEVAINKDPKTVSIKKVTTLGDE